MRSGGGLVNLDRIRKRTAFVRLYSHIAETEEVRCVTGGEVLSMDDAYTNRTKRAW